MRVLLDTHIWLWSRLQPERLGAAVRDAITDPEVEIWLSAITFWETAMLVQKGRLALASEPDAWIEEALRRVPVREVSVTRAIAVAAPHVDLPHRDPADRFLVATARVLDLTLATADQRIIAAQPVALLANTA